MAPPCAGGSMESDAIIEQYTAIPSPSTKAVKGNQLDTFVPPVRPLSVQRASSTELVSSNSGINGGGGGGILSGLARLVPLSMPRTSLRYKRHLSCADLGSFDHNFRDLQLKRDGNDPLSPTTRIRRCTSMPVASVSSRELVVNFPGGGKFFYWQSGVATFLNKHFDVSNVKLVGASAGSLTATLMACKVDARYATEVAVRILHKYNVWERPMGLVGVWGGVVRDWLDEILPENAAEICSGKVHISVLCLPYRRHHVNAFHSKADLIDTCMASAHLPVLMDGKPFAMWRGWPCVDGSIMAGRKNIPQELQEAEHVTFDYVDDEVLNAAQKDFMTLSDAAGLKKLVEMGYNFASRLSVDGRMPPTIQSLKKFDYETDGEGAISTSSSSSFEEDAEGEEDSSSMDSEESVGMGVSSRSGSSQDGDNDGPIEEEEDSAEQLGGQEALTAVLSPQGKTDGGGD